MLLAGSPEFVDRLHPGESDVLLTILQGMSEIALNRVGQTFNVLVRKNAALQRLCFRNEFVNFTVDHAVRPKGSVQLKSCSRVSCDVSMGLPKDSPA